MDKYSQLSLENRHQIRVLLDGGHNQSQIADLIGVHRSTISRELKRNVANTEATGNDYCPLAAQQLTDQRHAGKPKHRRFTDTLKTQVRRWLTTEKLSPELISGRWGVMGIDGVSHETIYSGSGKLNARGIPPTRTSTTISNTAAASEKGVTTPTGGAPLPDE